MAIDRQTVSEWNKLLIGYACSHWALPLVRTHTSCGKMLACLLGQDSCPSKQAGNRTKSQWCSWRNQRFCRHSCHGNSASNETPYKAIIADWLSTADWFKANWAIWSSSVLFLLKQFSLRRCPVCSGVPNRDTVVPLNESNTKTRGLILLPKNPISKLISKRKSGESRDRSTIRAQKM